MDHIAKEQTRGGKDTRNEGQITLSSPLGNLLENYEDVLGIYTRRNAGFITKGLNSGQQLLLSEFLVCCLALSWIYFVETQSISDFISNQRCLHLANIHLTGMREVRDSTTKTVCTENCCMCSKLCFGRKRKIESNIYKLFDMPHMAYTAWFWVFFVVVLGMAINCDIFFSIKLLKITIPEVISILYCCYAGPSNFLGDSGDLSYILKT